ncbi:hypothetical protein ACERK3_16955 [Phycisphaerales bacterium AB-hyl4]|uniref:Uncharacterized protein n=1 Tax=Natronomicrosphaera hydrolytica TaxID=3242702 RepID=A0ABV4U8N2_9BACT
MAKNQKTKQTPATVHGVKVRPGMFVHAWTDDEGGVAWGGIVVHVERDGCLIRSLTAEELPDGAMVMDGDGSAFFATWASVFVQAVGPADASRGQPR